MRSFRPNLLVVAALLLVAALAAGCGEAKIKVAKDDPTYKGAVLFTKSCAGCHTIDAAGTNGSTSGDKIAGQNFNYRHETVGSTLYALRNGGFGGGLMPGNIYVGEDAQDVARFVARWAGQKAQKEAGPAGLKQQGGSSGGTTTTH